MFDGKKLTQLMKEKKLTNAKLAEMVTEYGVEISEDSFKAYRQGRASPRMEVFDAIARVLDVPEQELFENSEEQKRIIARKEILENKELYIPMLPDGNQSGKMILRYINLQDGMTAIKNNDSILLEGKYLSEELIMILDKHTVLATMTGDSMAPTIKEHDILAIDMIDNRDFQNTDGIYLIRIGDMLNIKTVQFIGNNQVKLISSNTSYPTINPSDDNLDWELLGKVFVVSHPETYSKLRVRV